MQMSERNIKQRRLFNFISMVAPVCLKTYDRHWLKIQLHKTLALYRARIKTINQNYPSLTHVEIFLIAIRH